MHLSISMALSQQENNLLSREVRLLEPCFGAVKIFDHLTLLESSFKGLEHLRTNAPVLITTNAIRNLSFLDANVSDDGDGFVIAS